MDHLTMPFILELPEHIELKPSIVRSTMLWWRAQRTLVNPGRQEETDRGSRWHRIHGEDHVR